MESWEIKGGELGVTSGELGVRSGESRGIKIRYFSRIKGLVS